MSMTLRTGQKICVLELSPQNAMASATFFWWGRARRLSPRNVAEMATIDISSHSSNRKASLSPHRRRQAAFPSHAWPWEPGHGSRLPGPPSLVDGSLDSYSAVAFQRAINEAWGPK